VTEGVRRALTAIHPTVWLENVRFVSEEQCRSLAEALLTDAKLPIVHGSSSEKPARVLLEPLGPLQVAYDTLPVIKGLLVTQSLFGKAVLNSVGIVSKYTSTPHGTYHYFDSRPEEPDAPPVVLLHGMFTTSVSMGLLAPFIAQHRRVILPDMLEFDYGWSRSHSGEPLSWVGHIAALVEFIRGFGHGPLDIVGHSYGGWVAARMCRDYPDVVRRVVLLAPGGLGRYRSLASARLLVSKSVLCFIYGFKVGVTCPFTCLCAQRSHEARAGQSFTKTVGVRPPFASFSRFFSYLVPYPAVFLCCFVLFPGRSSHAPTVVLPWARQTC
jgi:pimeloyl-ACP methyl ester carboxylesterase